MTSPAGNDSGPDNEDVPSGLTREQAAQLLHVSPGHVDELVRLGHLAYLDADTRESQCGPMLLATATVQAYWRESKGSQAAGLAGMVDASERLGLYDDELAELPFRDNLRARGSPR